MPPSLACTFCGAKLSAPSNAAGRAHKCPKCGKPVRVIAITRQPAILPIQPVPLNNSLPQATGVVTARSQLAGWGIVGALLVAFSVTVGLLISLAVKPTEQADNKHVASIAPPAYADKHLMPLEAPISKPDDVQHKVAKVLERNEEPKPKRADNEVKTESQHSLHKPSAKAESTQADRAAASPKKATPAAIQKNEPSRLPELILGPELDKPLPEGWRLVRAEDELPDLCNGDLSDEAYAKKYSGHILYVGTVKKLGVDKHGKFIRFESGNARLDLFAHRIYYELRDGEKAKIFDKSERYNKEELERVKKEAESLKPGDRAGLHCAKGLHRLHFDNDPEAEARTRARYLEHERQEAKARVLLRQAERLVARSSREANFTKQVRERYQQIIDKYPDTQAAATARGLLDKLDR